MQIIQNQFVLPNANPDQQAQLAEVNRLFQEIAEGIVNGQEYDITTGASALVATNLERIYIPRTAQQYLNFNSSDDEIATQVLFRDTLVVNVIRLRQQNVADNSARVIAVGRAFLVSSKLYAATQALNGNLPLELLFGVEIPNAQIGFEAVRDCLTFINTKWGSYKSFISDVLINYGIAYLKRIKFIHLDQDNESHNAFWATISDAVRGELGNDKLVLLSRQEFRGLYHACGFKYLRIKTLEIASRLPEAIRLRIQSAPPGASLLCTGSAIFSHLCQSAIGARLGNDLRQWQPRLEAASSQIVNNADRFALHCRLFGYNVRLYHPYTQVVKLLAPMLMGYLALIGKKVSMAKQVVLTKATKDDTLGIKLWTSKFEDVLADIQAHTDFDILQGEMVQSILAIQMQGVQNNDEIIIPQIAGEQNQQQEENDDFDNDQMQQN